MSHEKQRKIAELKTASSIIGKGVLDFKRVFLTYAFILLINGIIYLLLQVYPNLENSLAASKLTPWGIITSIFTHSNLSHFASNMVGLFLFMFLFAFCNSTFHLNIKRRIERFFLVSAFLFAIFSNILWVSLIQTLQLELLDYFMPYKRACRFFICQRTAIA